MSEVRDVEKDVVFEYGEKFQADLIRCIIEYPHLTESWLKYIKPEYLKYPWNKAYVFIQYHFENNHIIPTREHLHESLAKELTADKEDGWDGKEIIDAIDSPLEPRNFPYIENNIKEFCKRQAYLNILNEQTLDGIAHGDYTNFDKLYEEAQLVDKSVISMEKINENIDKDFTQESDIHFTTGIDRIDNILNDGGPTTGDVVGILSPTGIGKTTALCAIGLANLIKQHNIIHITLEMPMKSIKQKYWTNMCKIPISLLKRKVLRDRAKDEIKKKLSETQLGTLVVVDAVPNSTSIIDIKKIIQIAEIKYHCKFQILIVDYMEKLGSIHKEKNKMEEYQRQHAVAVELFELTKELKLCTFTATQTNREGYKQKSSQELDLRHAAGSYDKMTPMGYWITITRDADNHADNLIKIDSYILKLSKLTETEKLIKPLSELRFNHNVQTLWKIVKNRQGPEGEPFKVDINYLTGEIQEFKGD